MLQADASGGYVDQSNPGRFVHRLRDGRIESFRPLRADHQLDGLRRIAQMRQKFLLVFCHVGPGWAMLGHVGQPVTPCHTHEVWTCGHLWHLSLYSPQYSTIMFINPRMRVSSCVYSCVIVISSYLLLRLTRSCCSQQTLRPAPACDGQNDVLHACQRHGPCLPSLLRHFVVPGGQWRLQVNEFSEGKRTHFP